MLSVREIAVGAAVLAAACNRDPLPRDTFEITLAFDADPGTYCNLPSCDMYGMTCDARLMLFIDDLEDGSPVYVNCDIVVEKDEADGSVCALENRTTPIYGIKPHRLRISLAVWRDGVMPPGCPADEIFDLDGKPRIDFYPRPAFGGSTYFNAGSGETVARLALACTEPQQLEREDCTGAAETTRVVAHVDDIDRGFDIIPEQAAQLAVGAAEPHLVTAAPPPEYVIDQGDTIDLEEEGGVTPPRFSTEIPGAMGATVCALVQDSESESTTSAACNRVTAGADPVDLRGILVPKDRLISILTALQLSDFPDAGLVIGRVLDHEGAPLAGVSVTPQAGVVRYLDEGLTGFVVGSTSASGYFISTDVAFDTRWTARHQVDGRREQGEVRAGLVRKKVSAFFVRMQPPQPD